MGARPHRCGVDRRGLEPGNCRLETQLVDVVLPVPLAQTFSYRFTPDERLLTRGDLVVVPFGRRREVIGLVTAAETMPAKAELPAGVRLRDVVRVLPPAVSWMHRT